MRNEQIDESLSDSFFRLSISIRNLLEVRKAISIPEKNADNRRQINITERVAVIAYVVAFQLRYYLKYSQTPDDSDSDRNGSRYYLR